MLVDSSRGINPLSNGVHKASVSSIGPDLSRQISNAANSTGVQQRKVLAGLYTESNAAKIWRVGQRMIKEDVSNHEFIRQ